MNSLKAHEAEHGKEYYIDLGGNNRNVPAVFLHVEGNEAVFKVYDDEGAFEVSVDMFALVRAAGSKISS